MESEKVKEIKVGLEYCTNHYGTYCYHCPYLEKGCNIKLMEVSLTLINELESENELLRNAKVVYETVDYCYEDLKKAEKRIAELEKEIEENAFYSKGYAQGIKNTYEVVIPEKLKKFAEKLKDKAIRRQEFIGELAIDDIEYVKTQDIDETLKECING